MDNRTTIKKYGQLISCHPKESKNDFHKKELARNNSQRVPGPACRRDG